MGSYLVWGVATENQRIIPKKTTRERSHLPFCQLDRVFLFHDLNTDLLEPKECWACICMLFAGIYHTLLTLNGNAMDTNDIQCQKKKDTSTLDNSFDPYPVSIN